MLPASGSVRGRRGVQSVFSGISVAGWRVVSLVSIASLVSGGVFAYAAHRFPGRSAVFEAYGGLLLIGGLVLLGASLPRF